MIQMQTKLVVADNSGARKLSCIHPLGGDTGRVAGLGDVITASVKEASPDGAVKRGLWSKQWLCECEKILVDGMERTFASMKMRQSSLMIRTSPSEPVCLGRWLENFGKNGS